MTRRTAIFVLTFTTLLLAADSPKPPPVLVAMFVDDGVFGKGPAMLEATLHADSEFRVVRITAAQIRAGGLKYFRVLLVPGGSSNRAGKSLGNAGREAVKKFVADGGTYVGICSG